MERWKDENGEKSKPSWAKSHGKQSKTYQSPLALARACFVVRKANIYLDVILEEFVSKLEVRLSSVHPVAPERVSRLNSDETIRDVGKVPYQVLS